MASICQSLLLVLAWRHESCRLLGVPAIAQQQWRLTSTSRGQRATQIAERNGVPKLKVECCCLRVRARL